MTDLTAPVAAAARAWFDRQQATRRDDARIDPDTGRPWTFDRLNALDQHAYRSLVLPIVAAAFEAHDCGRAEAWDEGFKQGGPMHDEHYGDPDAHTRNPYREAAPLADTG